MDVSTNVAMRSRLAETRKVQILCGKAWRSGISLLQNSSKNITIYSNPTLEVA